MRQFLRSLSLIEKNDLLGGIGLVLGAIAAYGWIVIDMMGR
jgi:hypothetical protein